jgi:hypothetical protein
MLGSIAANFIGEPQAMHWGPWFCLSSMALPGAVITQSSRDASPFAGQY